MHDPNTTSRTGGGCTPPPLPYWVKAAWYAAAALLLAVAAYCAIAVSVANAQGSEPDASIIIQEPATMQTPATQQTLIVGVTTPQTFNLPQGVKRLMLQSVDLGGAGGSISVFDATGSPLAMQAIGAGAPTTAPHWEVWTQAQNIIIERTGANVRGILSIYTY